MTRKKAAPAKATKPPAKKRKPVKQKHTAKGTFAPGPVYDPVVLVPKILAGLSVGTPLAVVCREAGMPSVELVVLWRKADAAVDSAFQDARELGFDAIAADCLRIADTTQIGERRKLTEDGGEEVTQEDMLGHRKLQIETRLKLLAKWDPRRYGEKIDLNHGGQKDNPLTALIARISQSGTSTLPITANPPPFDDDD